MTLDIASIRVALAAAQDPNAPDYAMWLAANDVPRWLEELCDENERLRAQIADQAMTDLVRETERLGLYDDKEPTP